MIRTGENWLIHLMKPKFLEPMLATAGQVGDIGRESDWAFELKWDGIRAIAVLDGEEVALFTRNGNDVSQTYPDIVSELAALDLRDTVLDGEIVAFDESGVPSFGRLQQGTGAATYLTFDVLRSGGRTLLNASYDERRAALQSLAIDGDVVTTPPAFDGSLAEAVQASRDRKLEGVVAKRRDSRYRRGKRSAAWLKLRTSACRRS
ncbi:hypothetical protein [Aeromicrobium sp. UC242_57]|uniref:ATP-dependent DNA ligase n=1 Tax=Aeromicrobium sp. UC242_57 TaxID=3374624 RepID=UPI003788EE99